MIAEVASEGRTAGIRSVFLDEGDSTYCGYSFATETNCTGLRLPRRVLAQLYQDKLTALRAAAALLNAHFMDMDRKEELAPGDVAALVERMVKDPKVYEDGDADADACAR